MMNAGGAAYFKGVGDPEEILGLKDEVLEKEGANMDKEMLVRVGNPLEALRNVEDHCDDEEVGYEQEDDGDVKKIPPPGIRDGQAFRVRDDNDVLEEEAGYGDDERSGNDYDEGEERKDEKRLEKTEMTNGCGKKGVEEEEEDEEPEEVVILNDDEGRDEEEAEVVRELPSSGGPPREVLEANDDDHEDEDDEDEEQEEDGDVEDVPLPKVGGARIYSVGDDEDGNGNDDDDGDELEEEEGGDVDDCDLNEDEEDDDDEEEEDEEFGTEYLVRPIARAEDEEHLSDFEPGEENDEDDDIDEDDDDDLDGIAKHGTSAKRKRAFEKDCSDNEEPSNR